jgi:hypothetical protein
LPDVTGFVRQERAIAQQIQAPSLQDGPGQVKSDRSETLI